VTIHKLRGNVTPDVRVDNHGSVCVLTPLSAAGEAWCEANIEADPNLIGSYHCDARSVASILAAMAADGLMFAAGAGFRPVESEEDDRDRT
jgi:hypothetical protein